MDMYEGFAKMRLESLKYWDNGRNHVLFDTSDDRFAVISGNTGSMEIHSQWQFYHFFRNEYDISYRCCPNRTMERVVRSGKSLEIGKFC